MKKNKVSFNKKNGRIKMSGPNQVNLSNSLSHDIGITRYKKNRENHKARFFYIKKIMSNDKIKKRK